MLSKSKAPTANVQVNVADNDRCQWQRA